MLKKIRAYLKEIKANAIVIPHNDSYFNEDLRPEDERLACLTGFTGSAGLAVITQKDAVLFVDGRYVEQAKKQTTFKVLHVPKQITVSEWFSSNLKTNDVVAYDPWLISIAQIERWASAFEQNKIKLKPLEENPIDKFWLTRPKAKPICEYTYPQKYAGKTTEEKLQNIVEVLKQNALDAFVLCNADTTSWLLNKRSDALLYNPVFMNRLIVKVKGRLTSFNEKNISSLKGKKVGIDIYETPVKIQQMLIDAGALVKKISNPFLNLQSIKNKIELKGMEKAGLFDSIAVCQFFACLPSKKASFNEYSVMSFLEEFRKENPLYRFKSFPDISATDKNSALPHYQANESNAKKLLNSTIYLLDTGGQYWCGTTDMTRTVCLSKPTQEMKKRYTQVLKGHIALANAVFPKNTKGGQLDALARQYLWTDGVDFDHGTGHGIGCFLNVHEAPPAISPNNQDILMENMVLSDEPGFYAPGKFGIRIENMMKVESCSKQKGFLKFEMLTFVPFCKELIEKSMLTNDEKMWINSYYKQIMEKVYPKVNKETQKWLKKQVTDWQD